MLTIKENIPLADFTTLRVGGPARFFASVTHIEDLDAVVTEAVARSVTIVPIGSGSNIVPADQGILAFVLRMGITGVEYTDHADHVLAVVSAGEPWDQFVADTISRELWGVENLSGIPGTTGATPVQNVGAYGSEVKDTIEWVEVFDTEQRNVRTLNPATCHFRYRDSFFKTEQGKGFIITRVAFRLSKTPSPKLTYRDLATRFNEKQTPSLHEIRTAVLTIRSSKFPDLKVLGTAGSFFKNPLVSPEVYGALQKRFPDLPGFATDEGVKISLAWILDHVCQLSGYREGRVGLFERQPLVLVNHGGATSEDIIRFAKKIGNIVKEKTGIDIEYEVRLF